MSDSVDLTGNAPGKNVAIIDSHVSIEPKSNAQKLGLLKNQLTEASLLVDDIVLKNYLCNLTDLGNYSFRR